MNSPGIDKDETEIDKEGTELVLKLERKIRDNTLDIQAYAHERDRVLGSANLLDSFVYPLRSILKGWRLKRLEKGEGSN